MYATLQLEELRRRADEFDVIHVHGDFLHLPMAQVLGPGNVVTTMHGRLDLPDYPALFAAFRDLPLVSISDQQRRPARGLSLGWHGASRTATQCLSLSSDGAGGDYVAFLGRISPEKRPDRAIEIARRAGMKIRIAAKIDAADREYFRTQIEPLFSQPHVEYVGEIGERDKCDFLGQCTCAAVPDRLAGTVRPGDDRSHVVRHPLRGMACRFGTRDHPGGT